MATFPHTSSQLSSGFRSWIALGMLLLYLLPSVSYLTGEWVHAGVHVLAPLATETEGTDDLTQLARSGYHSHSGSRHSHSAMLLDSLELAPPAEEPGAEIPFDYVPPIWHVPAPPQAQGLAASLLVHDCLPSAPTLATRWPSPPTPPPQASFSA